MSAWVFLATPALATAIAIALLRRTALARHFADLPNERSLHRDPTPRIGGMGLTIGAMPFVAVAAAGDAALMTALGCALFLAVVSALDDWRGLPVQVRLPAHAAAAMVFVLALGGASAGSVAIAAGAVLAIAWMANLFNFMDGSDGLAGGMAAVGFLALAAAAATADAMPLALACAALASGAAGFLAHNLPPARVFLGDCGSVPLGFLAGALGVFGIAREAWPAWFPVLVFSPFIVDATVTLLRRLLRGEAIWKAHRSHAYQRLVLAGWSHARLLVAACALMIAVAASALAALRLGAPERCAIIVAWLLAYLSLLIAIERSTGRPGTVP